MGGGLTASNHRPAEAKRRPCQQPHPARPSQLQWAQGLPGKRAFEEIPFCVVQLMNTHPWKVFLTSIISCADDLLLEKQLLRNDDSAADVNVRSMYLNLHTETTCYQRHDLATSNCYILSVGQLVRSPNCKLSQHMAGGCLMVYMYL